MLACAFLLMAVGIAEAQNIPQLQNPGFEAPVANGVQIPGWDVSIGKGADGTQIQTDQVQAKEGTQALRIESAQPGNVRISQTLFLPVGTTWKASVWVKGESLQ